MNHKIDETREVEQYFFNNPERGKFFKRFYDGCKPEKPKRPRGSKVDLRRRKREIWN